VCVCTNESNGECARFACRLAQILMLLRIYMVVDLGFWSQCVAGSCSDRLIFERNIFI
jgi:hypothetical protein